MNVVGQVLYGALLVFIALLWIRFIVDWVQVFARSWTPHGVVLVLLEVVYSITDPPLRTMRGWVPALRVGRFSLDIAWIALLISALILMTVVRSL